MKTITRNKCILCNNNLELNYSFSKFPIFMGTTNESRETDVCKDLNFSTCIKCGHVQLSNLIPLEALYEKSHNMAVGKTWDRHHLEFYEFIKKYAKGTLVEIGGGNLHLAKYLENESTVDKIIIYDTNTYEDIEHNKIEMREEFFNVDTAPKADMIIHSHLLEHLYNPIDELANMGKLLSNGAHMAIAVPLIDKMLEDNFTNAMNFEHTYMASYELIEEMLKAAGFTIIDNRKFSPYISFIVAKKTSATTTNTSRIYPNQLEILDNFIKYHLEEVKRIKENIWNYSRENTFIFGAHIFTQYLIKFGLDEGLFSNILDNDDRKIGNRLYGTDLIVKSPKILKDIENPMVVLKAAQYTEEIKKDILENINPNTKFIL